MNIRKLGMALVASATILTLAACGQSGKETYLTAHKNLEAAKTMDYSLDLSFDTKVKGELTAEGKQVEQVLKGVTGSFDVLEDREAKKFEVNMKLDADFEGQKIGLSFPILIDEKADKGYIKTESLNSFFSIASMFGVPTSLPEEAKGKVIEFPLETTEKDAKLAKELESKFNKLINDKINGLDEQAFTKEKGIVTVSFTEKDTEALIFDTLGLVSELDKETLSAEDLKVAKEEFKKNASFGKMTIQAKVEKDHFVSQNISMPVTIKALDGGELTITIKANTTYNSFDEKLKYTFTIDKKNVISGEEFEALMLESYSEEDYMTEEVLSTELEEVPTEEVLIEEAS